ncbi:hypothetical protein [Kitasatospora purpeofusca]|uniref:hypothetical protein n=1 Tax=Kitasatospora purpeofusca TaxID=67352 RepID=UPI003657E357
MPWAISRNERLTELRQRLADKGAVQSTLVPGTPAHAGLQREIDAIWTQIQELENSWNLNLKAVLIALAAIVLIAWRLTS